MIGYSNSISASLNNRPEELRQAAAKQAAVRAARSERRRAASEALEAARVQRDERAAFSWETYRGQRGAVARLLGRTR